MAGGDNPPKNLTAKGNHFVRPSGKKVHLGLDQAAKMWSHHSQWATPLARDWKGTNSPEHVRQLPPARNHMDQLANFAVYSRQALTISGDGEFPSDQRRGLNPAFVEALIAARQVMLASPRGGWPTGWTGFDFAATAWSPWLQRMRSELLRLGSAMMDDEAAQ